MLNTTSLALNTSTEENASENQSLPIPFWVFLFTEVLVTIVANAMLCWLFITNKKLRTNQNYFIVSLSAADLFVGVSVIPCEYCRIMRGVGACPTFCGSVISFNMIASVLNLVLICADRHMSINKPFKYVEVFSKRRAVLIILVTWLFTITLTCLPLSWMFSPSTWAGTVNVTYSAILFSAAVIAGICLAVSYYKIVSTIIVKMRAAKEAPSNPAGVKVCIISSVIFFVSWIPYFVLEMYLQYADPHIDVTVGTLMDIAYFVLLLSPCLDPILYAYYRRDFRGSAVQYFRRNFPCFKGLCCEDQEKSRDLNHADLDPSVKRRLMSQTSYVADSNF